MRRRLILIVSAGLNVVLAAVVFFSRPRGTAASSESEANTQNSTSNHVKTQVVVRKQFFSWQQLESPDYPTYIAHLREIGCPEQTIRDIIIADVTQLYAKKRLAELAAADPQWWRSDSDEIGAQAAGERAEVLDRERRALLAGLLGPDWEVPNYTLALRYVVGLGGPAFTELSPDAKQSVQDIAARSRQRLQNYMDAQQKDGKAADPVQLARLHQQTRAELAQILNPAQLEEFLLRYSQTAADLRAQLRGVEVTPDEFRTLFRTQDPVEQQLLSSSDNDATAAQQRAALQKKVEDSLKEVLGPDRYQAYRMAQDATYRDAVTLAQQAGAPPARIQSLYDLLQTTRQEEARIRNDSTLTDEQKAQELKDIADQQKKAQDQLLGAAQTQQPQPPLPSTAGATAGTHAYSPGETVEQIAVQYGVSANDILSANPNVDFHSLKRGQPINIPAKP
ncbi:MAG TPA: LysM peptidoglycan-binding domain-containing protein [Verrucomicrobiae bacterium]|nr:LysM peptidoglycan-binding domain-containing protein [Verrucomicrobiae bacterium]